MKHKVFAYDYPRAAVTVDVVLLRARGAEVEVLLIRRGKPPFAGAWALPGGFLEMDEELAAGAARELAEETAVRLRRLYPLGAYGKVGRDPRGRTVSVVFLGCLPARQDARAGDDAADARWFALARPPRLAFDHRVILKDARVRLRELAATEARWRSAFGARADVAVRRALRRAARARS